MATLNTLDAGRNEPIHSVSEINRLVKNLLTDTFPVVWVEGEVSRITKHRNGHWYFDIKDDRALLSCVMWSSNNRRVTQEITQGKLVRIRASLSLYERDGRFQADVKAIQLAGHGALQEAYERLKQKLDDEGLFDPGLKRQLPDFPERIAILTSAQGDAKRDVIINIRRRYPLVDLHEVHCSVQGARAEKEVVQALRRVGEMEPKPDLAILTRGGGSIEDLWTFNLESVARAIRACKVPVVSAIGHEPDRTIADFVADLRAPTPSTAAELVTPDKVELHRLLSDQASYLHRFVDGRMDAYKSELKSLTRRVVNPADLLHAHRGRVNELASRLNLQTRRYTTTAQQKVEHQLELLNRASPRTRIATIGDRLRTCNERLIKAVRDLRADCDDQVQRVQTALTSTVKSHFTTAKHEFEVAKVKLIDPRDTVRQRVRDANDLKERLRRAIAMTLDIESSRHDLLATRMQPLNPTPRIRRHLEEVERFDVNLRQTLTNQLSRLRDRTENLEYRLASANPVSTLERGYAIVAIPDSTEYGQPISSVNDVDAGEAVQINLAEGKIFADVTEILDESSS